MCVHSFKHRESLLHVAVINDHFIYCHGQRGRPEINTENSNKGELVITTVPAIKASKHRRTGQKPTITHAKQLHMSKSLMARKLVL